MKKVIVFAGVVILAVATWLIYSRVVQARREAGYHTALAPFQRDLPTGTSRAAVEKYLDSRKIDYVVSYGGSEADTYQIKIAEESGGLFCKDWKVYVALEFGSDNKLREVHIRKLGTCL